MNMSDEDLDVDVDVDVSNGRGMATEYNVLWEVASLEEAKEKVKLEKHMKIGNVKRKVKKFGGSDVYNYKCINEHCNVRSRLVHNNDQWQFEDSGVHKDDCGNYARRGLSEEHSSRMKVCILFCQCYLNCQYSYMLPIYEGDVCKWEENFQNDASCCSGC